MKQTMFISILALVPIPTLVHSAEQKEYLSPDGKYRAYVFSLPNALGSRECQITIQVKNGRTLCSKSYASEDGEHGFGVEKAAWTPDSKFFVYSMSSSGGHQSWRFPTDFIPITDCKIRNLDNYVGPITDPGFILSAPDYLKTVGRNKSSLDEAHFKVRLSKLVTREKKK
jgi:dipeptidyl aminopeptidase/acylaminoacyl peptidase